MATGFVLETRFDAPIDAVFAASLDLDLHRASMASSGERAVGGRTSGRIGLGESVTWSALHFGVRWRMTSRIAELDEPHRFVDEQTRGPFARFRHEHRFEPAESGASTVAHDTVEFAAPLGVLGRLVERPVLRPSLRRLIAGRNAHLVAALAERQRPQG